ncbi:MAG: hypothetical protein WCY09_06890 [Candidatus Omnitrophota bacterium]
MTTKNNSNLICWFVVIFIGVMFFCVFLIFKGKFIGDVNNGLVPKATFFPIEKSLINGYRITPIKWRSLNAKQKLRFVVEGLKEIGEQEGYVLRRGANVNEVTSTLDKTVQLFALGGVNNTVINILFGSLSSNGGLVCDSNFVKKKNKITGILNDLSISTVDLFKTYSGYTSFYKKDNDWFMGKNPPSVGEICEYVIYSKYTTFPSGFVMLSSNYPLNFIYKIKSIEEINSFFDDYGFDAHYYEVTFEPIERKE